MLKKSGPQTPCAPVRGVYYALTSRRDGSPDRQRGVRVRGPKEPSAARFGGSFVLPGGKASEPRAGLRSALPVLPEQRDDQVQFAPVSYTHLRAHETRQEI